MQIVVNLIVVKLFSFSIITRPRYFGIGPYLVRLKLQVSRSFLHTVYPSNTARKRKKSNFKIFEISKKVNDYLHVSVYIYIYIYIYIAVLIFFNNIILTAVPTGITDLKVDCIN